jgi:hypothetical protein
MNHGLKEAAKVQKLKVLRVKSNKVTSANV